MKSKTNNRVYILIIIFLVIINLYLLMMKSAAEDNLKTAKRINSFNVKQIEMIDYIGKHIRGISDYSNLILENEELLRDDKSLSDNGLDHFLDYKENHCSITILDDFTVYYEYICDYDKNRKYSFYYVSEINDENAQYINNCISINDNIFVKPHDIVFVMWEE